MIELLRGSAILAAGGNFDKFQQMGAELRRRTTEGTGDDLFLLGVVALIVPLFVVALFALVRMQERRESLNSPKALFRELCKAHQLTGSQRNLLKHLAAGHNLTDPARIFLEPERFDPGRLSSELQSRAADLESLRKLLFARDPAVSRDALPEPKAIAPRAMSAAVPARDRAPAIGLPVDAPASPLDASAAGTF
ncbi:MAG: hypothetical protein K1X74_13455 [Pirellulales bacterium]|nr:hypothetical protein [Pirellulales bacterium]